MATRSHTDQGAAAAAYQFDGARDFAEVTVRLTNGTAEVVSLTAAEVAAALTPAQRTSLRALLGALYPVALGKLGFA